MTTEIDLKMRKKVITIALKHFKFSKKENNCWFLGFIPVILPTWED
jgi:hypothetical protein